jgi:hypothetical protein
MGTKFRRKELLSHLIMLLSTKEAKNNKENEHNVQKNK